MAKGRDSDASFEWLASNLINDTHVLSISHMKVTTESGTRRSGSISAYRETTRGGASPRLTMA